LATEAAAICHNVVEYRQQRSTKSSVCLHVAARQIYAGSSERCLSLLVSADASSKGRDAPVGHRTGHIAVGQKLVGIIGIDVPVL
jgi:hypothetical protein